MKDILVLLDTSKSINASNFNNKVKPFLKELAENEDLAVGPQGTHIAIVGFSSKEKTMKLLDFTYGESYSNAVDGMEWNIVQGNQTKTSLGFKKAGEVHMFFPLYIYMYTVLIKVA